MREDEILLLSKGRVLCLCFILYTCTTQYHFVQCTSKPNSILSVFPATVLQFFYPKCPFSMWRISAVEVRFLPHPLEVSRLLSVSWHKFVRCCGARREITCSLDSPIFISCACNQGLNRSRHMCCNALATIIWMLLFSTLIDHSYVEMN